MSDRLDFMTDAEMRKHFPNSKPGLSLVTLIEHDGEHMWTRDAHGWWRLDGEPKR